MEEVKKQGTESLFVPYEIAVELKKLGFGESCFGYYTVDEVLNFDSFKMFKGSDLTTLTSQSDWTTLAPLWQQAFRFFREKYMLSGEIYIFKNFWNFDIEDIDNSIQLYTSDITSYSTYEEAELECLVKLIELAKEQNVK